MNNTVVRNVGSLGRRVLAEFMLIRYSDECKIDFTVSISAGTYHGIGLSILCPYFLIELNLLPLKACTQAYYMDNG